MHTRRQQTIARPAMFRGFGFLTGADVTVRFLPADENTGIHFQRIDLPGTNPIPATLDSVIPRQRRTAISNGKATVELIEHVMAALAGLQIDNCLIQLDGPELPGGDGSSIAFVNVLLESGITKQAAQRKSLFVCKSQTVRASDGRAQISVDPISRDVMLITYELDYGPQSPIKAQSLTYEFSTESFVRDLAFSRTFILETEINQLKSQGYGSKVTHSDLLIFGESGVIGNQLRATDECVRHKILDCIGDFALLGCDVYGHFKAHRSGHNLNHDICRGIALDDAMIGKTRKAA